MALVGVLGGFLLVAPGRALAVSYPSTFVGGPVYWCTSTQAFCMSPLANPAPAQPVAMRCYWDDRGIRWFYAFLQNGQEGFVDSKLVSRQVVTPMCGSVNWLGVTGWSIARIGQAQWLSGDGPHRPPYRTIGGSTGNWWEGYCLSFAGDAWYPWGGFQTGQYPNNVWDYYNARGLAHVGGRPPRGALVFWGTAPQWHIAISLGNWMAVGTLGVDGMVPIRRTAAYNINSIVNYTGWVMPPQAAAPFNSF
jgi:hypothetical protein